MTTPEVLAYVRAERQAGFSTQAIKEALTRAGWDAQAIEQIFLTVDPPPSPLLSVSIKPQHTISPQPRVSNTREALSVDSAVEIKPLPARPIVLEKKPSSYKPFVEIVLVIIALCAAGAGGVYYWTTLHQISPNEIVQKVLMNSATIQSLSFMATTTGTIATSNVAESSVPQNFSLVSQGDVGRNNPAGLQIAASLSAQANFTTATDTISFSTIANTLYQEHNLYFNIGNFNLTDLTSNNLPSQGEFFVGIINQLASSLQNKWVVTSSQALASSSPYQLSSTNLSPLYQYLQGMSFVASTLLIDTESLNGIQTYHLRISLQNGPGLLAALQATFPNSPLFMTPAPSVRAADIQSDLVQPILLDVWVGESDFRIYRITMAPITLTDRESGFTATVGTDVLLENYNDQQSISPPASATPLSQLWQGSD
jgi:hypothetical protein